MKKILFLPIHMRFHNFALEGIINCFKKIFGIHRIQIGKFLDFLFMFHLTDVWRITNEQSKLTSPLHYFRISLYYLIMKKNVSSKIGINHRWGLKMGRTLKLKSPSRKC